MLAEYVEQLRKELAKTEAEVARLEAAEVVVGQFIEADRGGGADNPHMDAELERAITAPGAGGMLLVPRRELGTDASVLPEDDQAVVQVVAGRRSLPGQGKSVSGWARGRCPARWKRYVKLKRLAERGWLHLAGGLALRMYGHDRDAGDVGTTTAPAAGATPRSRPPNVGRATSTRSDFEATSPRREINNCNA